MPSGQVETSITVDGPFPPAGTVSQDGIVLADGACLRVSLPTKPGSHGTVRPKTANGSAEWLDLSPGTVREGALTVAQLSRDFDLMVQKTIQSPQPQKTQPLQALMCHCIDPRSLSFGCSIATVVSLSLLALHCFIIDLAGVAILPLVGALVFLYIVFLQKKRMTVTIMLGSLIAALCIILFCILVLIVWGLNWKVLLDKTHRVPSNSGGGLTAKADDVAEEGVVHVWGCPKGVYSLSRPDTLSTLCVTNHVIMGALAMCTALSALGVVAGAGVILSKHVGKTRSSEQILYKRTALLDMMQHTSPSGVQQQQQQQRQQAVLGPSPLPHV